MRRLLALVLLLSAPVAAPLPATAAATPRLSYALECLALNVYWEAAANDPVDQLAVAYVTLNRVRAPGFPTSICAVVHQGGESPRFRCQFHWWCDGQSDEPANAVRWQAALAAARAAMARSQPDPTGGAMWFHNQTVTPDWAARKQRTVVIGGHSYYK